MKHKRNRHCVKLGIFLLGLTLFFIGCVDERNFLNEPQAFGILNFPKQKAAVIEGNQIPLSILNFIDTKTNGSKLITTNKSIRGFVFANGIKRSEAFGTIDDNRSVMVDLETQTRYTFLVRPNEPNPRELINLVILEDDTQTQEYFVKYEFETDYQDSSVSGWIDLGLLSGTVSYFDAEGDLTGQFSLGQSTSRNTSSGTGMPCPPEDDDDDDTDDTSDNNSGSGCIAGVTCEGDNGNDDDQNDDNDDNSSTGSGNGGEICEVETTYARCGCGGNADGHPPSGESCCAGSATIVTFTCGQGRSSRVDGVNCDDTVGVIFGHNKECKKINDFLDDAENATFKQKLLELASPANAGQYLDVNFETAISIHEFHTDVEQKQGDANSREVDVSFIATHTNRVKAFAHTHPNGVGTNGTYSIFSFEDLIGISKFLSLDKIDTDNFVAFLITKKEDKYTYYALTINNKSKFKDFFYYYTDYNFNLSTATQEQKDKRISAFHKSKDLRDKYYNREDAKIRPENVNSELILKQFLAFTVEADESFSNFTKVALKNPSEGSASDVKRRDCN